MRGERLLSMMIMTVLAGILFPRLNFAETIVFESGRKIEGEVVQKTNEKIRVDIGGGVLRTYNIDEIRTINGRNAQAYRPNAAVPEEKKEKEESAKKQEKESLKKGAAYLDQDIYDEAIIEFTRVIEINPKDASAYHSRALAYFFQKDYDKAWKDVRKAQNLGYDVGSEFLEELKQATQKKEPLKPPEVTKPLENPRPVW